MLARTIALFVAFSTLGATAQGPRANWARATAPHADRVQPNDNRTAAGTMHGGVLALHLEARVAMWHPDGDDAPGAAMPAFAEEGGPARIPGPLLRVLAGKEVEVSIRNSLGDTLVVHGLHARSSSLKPADAVPIAIAPGEQRTVHFRLDAPGTYYYWGTTTGRPINFRTREDAQLTGAIVVDDPAAGPPRDRVFVIGMWSDTVHRAMTHRQRVLAVINGRSWPHTERLQQSVGDTVRWRMINASADLHPMHLHGFYFRVDSRGDSRRDTAYAAVDRGIAVTESMPSGSTVALTWVPDRPGNWLFHCHIPEHFGPRGSLGLARGSEPATSGGVAAPGTHESHAASAMNGMVMGIDVRPIRATARSTPRTPMTSIAERHIRLLVRPNAGSSAAVPLYGYALHEDGAEPRPDSGIGVGPTLDLRRLQPVRITVVNRLPEATAVHWHGIELDSYYDGVPGFSGASHRVAPLIAPGDSFVVRFTPRRAGTFIYHTHAHEERQQLAGLAGAIVVRDSGARRDPATDIPIVLSAPTDFGEQRRSVLVNGSPRPAPLGMTVGTTYRLRFVQMSESRAALRVELWRDTMPSAWRAVAKDGAELPASRRVLRPARALLGIGETYDVEVTPDSTGPMRLEIRLGPQWPAPSALMTTLPIVVSPTIRSDPR